MTTIKEVFYRVTYRFDGHQFYHLVHAVDAEDAKRRTEAEFRSLHYPMDRLEILAAVPRDLVEAPLPTNEPEDRA